MASRKSASSRPAPSADKSGQPAGAYATLPVVSLETAVLALMEDPLPAYGQRPRNQAAAAVPNTVREDNAPLHERTVRLRQPGGKDRRFSLKAMTAPDDARAVIFELRPLSDRPLPSERPRLLSTQQAADYLNVSRPYIVKLVERGAFKGVQRTAANHRRIPAAEVEKMAVAMRDSRSKALRDFDKLAASTHAHDLEAALTSSGRRWTRKS
ncbi:excisionase family DNA-binding protein [Pseudomonadota bacterium AL_CKDN230030165-1A_HGKHYDSX7]